MKLNEINEWNTVNGEKRKTATTTTEKRLGCYTNAKYFGYLNSMREIHSYLGQKLSFNYAKHDTIS